MGMDMIRKLISSLPRGLESITLVKAGNIECFNTVVLVFNVVFDLDYKILIKLEKN